MNKDIKYWVITDKDLRDNEEVMKRWLEEPDIISSLIALGKK